MATVSLEDQIRKIGKALVNNEYKIWKNQVPFLYDLADSHALDSFSLTVEWLPERVEVSDRSYSVQKIIIGTHADSSEPNYLIIAQVKLPLLDDRVFDEESDNLDLDDHYQLESGADSKIEILHQIPHAGEVLRARHKPRDPFFIATKTNSSEVHIFDYRNHPTKFPIGGTSNPDLRLTGHNSGGLGLSWSNIRNSYLLSSSDDSSICLWDIIGTPVNRTINALQTYKVHQGPVKDVSWHWKHEYSFASCGDDGCLHTFDRRLGLRGSVQSIMAHQRRVNALSFNRLNEFMVATGSTDKTIKVFDMRNLTSALYTFNHHKDEVVQIGWSPHNKNIIASSSGDMRLAMLDTSRVGQEQTPEDEEEGPPELIFVHGGHTNRVSDFSWNRTEDWVIASVGDDSTLQVWQMGEHIYDGQ
ncbi:multicopy suppressor of Ira1 [Artemisia annua]|uniref:Multicopy suppressor of Ira1 n=1 Tax=Artemisia annua TaxID=35608 RepID=A0A2U1M4F6_ARTAN|nr:multicopy suppressor of Ira1 [Artemisia annua]